MTSKFSSEVANKLLDKLSTDDDFRALFEADPRAAMSQLGHETPEADHGIEGRDPVLPFQRLKGGLASKEKIAAGSEQMKQSYQASTLGAGARIFGPFDFCSG